MTAAALVVLYLSMVRPTGRHQRRRKPAAPSFATRLQQAKTAPAALDLCGEARTDEEVIKAIGQLTRVVPHGHADVGVAQSICHDDRLARSIRSLSPPSTLSPSQRCTLLWAFGMIVHPEAMAPSGIHLAASQLAAAMNTTVASRAVAAHVAESARWGCSTLNIPAPGALCRRADECPFALHVGAVRQALDAIASDGDGSGAPSAAVAALAAELPLRRETIASGSATPSKSEVAEDRGTAWLSDSGRSFAYSGKVMAAGHALTPNVRRIRDAVDASIGERYCSCLANHYPDGRSGMRFHSDPGQGDDEGGWGYSTCVVSCGEARSFIFRQVDDPTTRCSFIVRHGDVLHMHDDCQQRWQHSVLREAPGGELEEEVATEVGSASRVSLVFKRPLSFERALPRRQGRARASSSSSSPLPPPVEATAGVTIASGESARQAGEDGRRWEKATAGRRWESASQAVLEHLRAAVASGDWPPTGAGRARVLRGCGLSGIESGAMMTLTNPASLDATRQRSGKRARGRAKQRQPNALFPELASAVFALEEAAAGSAVGWEPGSLLCAVGVNVQLEPHAPPTTHDARGTLAVSLGSFERGGHIHHGGGATDGSVGATCTTRDARQEPCVIPDDGSALWTSHASSADSFLLLYFTPPAQTADAASLAARLDPPLRYRRSSTDELVIAELLGEISAYDGPPRGDPRWDWEKHGSEPFSARGHTVLDVGAQIGAFSRAALGAGCTRLVAVEPERSNAELWRQNCAGAVEEGRALLVEAAVAHGAPPSGGTARLMCAPVRSDGVVNTWRHALEGLSHYATAAPRASSNGSGSGSGGSSTADGPPCDVHTVTTVPLFGDGGLLERHGPVSFIKLDCEGAELELLRHLPPSGLPPSVTRLVFEWSFTKPAGRCMASFATVVAALEADGFDVWYEGIGNWEHAITEDWPWHSDAIVFAARARVAARDDA